MALLLDEWDGVVLVNSWLDVAELHAELTDPVPGFSRSDAPELHDEWDGVALAISWLDVWELNAE